MPRRPRPPARARGAVTRPAASSVAALLLAGCAGAPLAPEPADEEPARPTLGACYRLTPEDVARPSTDAPPVPCTGPHTAETFAIGTIPAATGPDHGSREHGRWVYDRCEKAFGTFLSADESLVLRTQLSWAWFRPSERAWEGGARWYRCDVVGGPSDASAYAELPRTAKGLFRARPPQQWLTCARGRSVAGSPKVPCSEPHDWRAVTTIKLGEPDDPYPGDRLVQVRSRDFCSDSVGAWMNYPVDYEFGFTWFREAEWQAGNRRSVCWARTDQ